jgi:hypothetical protein
MMTMVLTDVPPSSYWPGSAQAFPGIFFGESLDDPS